MSGYITAIAILTLPGLIAALWDCKIKSCFKLNTFFSKAVFYISVTDVFICLLKYYRGFGNVTLVAAFSPISTLVKFGSVALIAAFLLPVVIQKRLSGKAKDAFDVFFRHGLFYSICSGLITVMIAVFTNEKPFSLSVFNSADAVMKYGTLFVLTSLFITIAVMLLPKSIKVSTGRILSKAYLSLCSNDKRPFEYRLSIAALVDFTFVFSVIVFIPYELFLGNASEFNFEFSKIWSGIALEAVALFAVLLIIQLFLKGKLFDILVSLVFGITLASYAQSMLFNGTMQKLDGTQGDWSGTGVIINLVLWCVIAIIPVILSMFWKKIWRAVCSFGSVLIAGMQIVALVGMLFTVGTPNIETRITSKGICEVSGKNNVVVFVLDKFDQKYVEPMLKDIPQALDGLRGFTYYPNTTGKYCYTHIAVPYLLSGVKIPEYDPTEQQFLDQIENSKFLNYVTDNCGSVGIYTNEYCLKSTKERLKTENCITTDYVMDNKRILNTAIKSSLYRVMPFKLKSTFMYSATDFNSAVQPGIAEDLYDPDTHKTEEKIMTTLKETGLSINESYGDNCFRFIHLKGLHEHWQLDRSTRYSQQILTAPETAAGEFNLISEYCRQLENLGLYKNTTIIITADHGRGYVLTKTSDSIRNANPILFYKPAGASYSEEIKTSNAPTSHDDIFATVINALGGNGSEFGKSIAEINEDVSRIRYFYWCMQDPEIANYESCIHVEYAINGDARDNNNWSETGNRVYPNNNPRHVDAN